MTPASPNYTPLLGSKHNVSYDVRFNEQPKSVNAHIAVQGKSSSHASKHPDGRQQPWSGIIEWWKSRRCYQLYLLRIEQHYVKQQPGHVQTRIHCVLFATTVNHTSNRQSPSRHDNFKDEFDSLHLLTQYIKLAKIQDATVTNNNPGPGNSQRTVKDQEIDKLKETYLDKTDHIDKMQGHCNSLLKAVTQNRIPSKLKIQLLKRRLGFLSKVISPLFCANRAHKQVIQLQYVVPQWQTNYIIEMTTLHLMSTQPRHPYKELHEQASQQG